MFCQRFNYKRSSLRIVEKQEKILSLRILPGIYLDFWEIILAKILLLMPWWIEHMSYGVRGCIKFIHFLGKAKKSSGKMCCSDLQSYHPAYTVWVSSKNYYMKRSLSWFGTVAVIIVIGAFFWTQRTHAPAITEENIGWVSTTTQLSDDTSLKTEQINSPKIEVSSPLPNKQVTSPLTITGRAQGGWYFEASFPIELRDANNVLIAKTTGQAQGDWMTEQFVPFTATLTFPTQPTGSQGMLTFKNDNPSGEPKNSIMFDVPVQF